MDPPSLGQNGVIEKKFKNLSNTHRKILNPYFIFHDAKTPQKSDINHDETKP